MPDDDLDDLLSRLDDLETADAAEIDALTSRLEELLGTPVEDEPVDVDAIWQTVVERLWPVGD